VRRRDEMVLGRSGGLRQPFLSHKVVIPQDCVVVIPISPQPQSTAQAGQNQQTTGMSLEDEVRNNILKNLYPSLQKAKQMRDQLKQMKAEGTSESDPATYNELKGSFNDLTMELSKAYACLLQDPRNENNFWVNWDYATLWALKGDRDSALTAFAHAISELPPEQQKSMMQELKMSNLAQLDWKEDYSNGQFKQTTKGWIQKKIDESWVVYNIKSYYQKAIAVWESNNQKAEELKGKWRNTFSGDTLGQSAEQAAK